MTSGRGEAWALACICACACTSGGGGTDTSGTGDATTAASTAALTTTAPPAPTTGAADTGATTQATTGTAPQLVELAIRLDRLEADGPDIIVADVTLTVDGAPSPAQTVTLTAEGGAASGVTDLGDGRYRGEVTPGQPSGEVRVHVEALGQQVERTAIVLPTVHADWAQPECVRGPVNTDGYEDSIELSHDGQWLIVSSYSPIDLLCCLTGCDGVDPADPAGAACNTALGPYAAPERPDFPGAARIVSPTEIHDELPSLGIDLPDGQDFPAALPPVSAYGFRRQPDGSYDEPFAIAFAADGSTVAPFGFAFITTPQSTTAQVLHAWNDLRVVDGSPEDSGNDLWRETLTLGQHNNLGNFTTPPMSTPQVDRVLTRLPLADHTGQQGNPAVTPDGVWWDSEDGAFDLFYAPGDVTGDALGPAVVVALSDPDRREYQPHLYNDRLYFSSEHAEIRSSARAPGGDPAAPGTWSAEQVDLACEPGSPRDGAIVAIGEPSLATLDGAPTLFFVYARHGPEGYRLGVAQVPARTNG